MRHGILMGRGWYSGLKKVTLLASTFAFAGGCSSASSPTADTGPSGSSSEFVSTPLKVGPTFVASTGVLTITPSDETAEIYLLAADLSLVVNGVQAIDASTKVVAVGAGTKANVKSIVVTAASPNSDGDVVILNYVNGLFGQGTATVAGTAITFTAGKPNQLIVKGTPGNDSFAAGLNGLSLNTTKPTLDVTFTNAPTLNVFLGAGDDKFTSAGNTALGAAFAGTGGLTIYGGAGNDTLLEGAALTMNETWSGGAGVDVVDYSLRPAGSPVSVAIDPLGVITSGGNVGTTAATLLAFTTPGDPTGGAFESDKILDTETILGSLGPDQMTGGIAGSVTLNGGAGNDLFFEGGPTYKGGTDILIGGGGVDTVDYSQRTASLTVVMDGKTPSGDLVGGTEQDIVGADITNILTGGTAASVLVSTITGNTLSNVFTPGPGVNVINGLAGDDTVKEGLDANNTGHDTFNGGTGIDVMDYSQRGYLALTGTYAVTGASAAVVTTLDESSIVSMGNLVTFTSQPGVYYTVATSTAMAITLSTPYTGATAAATTATDGSVAGTTHVVAVMDGATTSGQAASGEIDKIGTDVENLYGGGGADVLTGNALDNDIEGNIGNDTLVGLLGNDTLVGASAAGGAEANLVHGNDLADSAESGAFNVCDNIGSAGTPTSGTAALAVTANCEVTHY